MLTRSLHGQVLLVLVILTSTLLAQLLLSRGNLATLSNNQKTIIQSYDNVGLVYELERDVIDLQRNVLIYKETASDSSVQRFYSVMERVEKKIILFQEKIDKEKGLNIDKDLISRMTGHLDDYQDNFSSVINGRSKREEISSEVDSLLLTIKNESEMYFKASNKLTDVLIILSDLESAFNAYLVSFDSEDTENFKSVIKELKVLISKYSSNKSLLKSVNQLNKKFIRLTHVTRGYVYLVNVVMAGSANEFLYLSESIRKAVEIEKNNYINESSISSKQIHFNNNITAFISIIIVALIAWFLSKRILLPIKGITHVFRVLSRGDQVDEIPSTSRKDEVGDLAKAAAVFHDKNKQTQELLEQSQDMIANQEVMNIQLEAEKDKAEKAAESKSMFLANMSHEIRTPMNGIVGLVDLVLKTNLTEKQKKYLSRIAYSGQIMMNVINDILDFSKIEAGKMEIEKVSFEINTVIENLMSAMAVRVKEKPLNFNVYVSKNVPKALLGDPLRISQILLNLCSNSIKFTDSGRVQVNFDYMEKSLFVEVLDTGIGMNKKQVESVFQSFTQADGSTSRKYGGTGLGLTIVKQLVKLMGGEVRVASQENEGTQMFIRLKLEESSKSNAVHTLEIEDNELIYVVDGELENTNCVKLDSDMLKNFGLSLNTLVVGDEDELDIPLGKQPIIFQSNRLEFLQRHKGFIDDVLKKEISVGFMMQTQSYSLKKYVYEKWSLSSLKHPYTPNQVEAYLLTLFGINVDKKTQENLPQKNKQYAGHVLLVEDNVINQMVAGDMLEELGLSYDLAEDGKRSIEKIESNPEYNMVFMDVQMPVMDGYSATKKLREMGYENLIICGLSANALSEDLAKAKEVGMNDYLTKPLQILELESVVEKYLVLKS